MREQYSSLTLLLLVHFLPLVTSLKTVTPLFENKPELSECQNYHGFVNMVHHRFCCLAKTPTYLFCGQVPSPAVNGSTPDFPRGLRPVGANLTKVSLASYGYKTCGVDASGNLYCAVNATNPMAPLQKITVPFSLKTVAISDSLLCGTVINTAGGDNYLTCSTDWNVQNWQNIQAWRFFPALQYGFDYMDIAGNVLCGTNSTGSLWCTYDISDATPVWVDIANPFNQWLRSVDVTLYHFCGIFGNDSSLRQILCADASQEKSSNWYIVAVRNSTDMPKQNFTVPADDFAVEEEPELGVTYIFVLDRRGGPPLIAYTFNSSATTTQQNAAVEISPAVEEAVLVLFWLIVVAIPVFTAVYVVGTRLYSKYYGHSLIPLHDPEEEGQETETAPMQDKTVR